MEPIEFDEADLSIEADSFQPYEAEAEGYGRVTVEQKAQFDSLVRIRLSNGETAFTSESLVKRLDT